jgi:hypothetical protein
VLIRLYPGTRTALANAMEITRQGLYHFLLGRHVKAPWWLCSNYSKELQRSGTMDGSPVPKGTELVRAWTASFGKPNQ